MKIWVTSFPKKSNFRLQAGGRRSWSRIPFVAVLEVHDEVHARAANPARLAAVAAALGVRSVRCSRPFGTNDAFHHSRAEQIFLAQNGVLWTATPEMDLTLSRVYSVRTIESRPPLAAGKRHPCLVVPRRLFLVQSGRTAFGLSLLPLAACSRRPDARRESEEYPPTALTAELEAQIPSLLAAAHVPGCPSR